MILIAAADKKWGIGKDGNLLTFLPKDLEFFKQATLGKTIVVGRKTLNSFKGGKPLPKRQHIVLSRTATYDHERITVVRDLDQFERSLEDQDPETVFVSGGGEIYRLLLPYCHKAYITMLDQDFESDTFMPDLSEHGFRCLLKEQPITENGVTYRHTTWVRQK